MRVSEREVKRALYRASYADFFKAFWSTVNPGTPLDWNWHLQLLCDRFQEVMERVFVGQKKLGDEVINVSPGTSKSSIFSIFSTPWIWTRMPHCVFLGGSHTEDLALLLSRKSRDVVASKLYQELFPEIVIRPDVDSKMLWANTYGGERRAVGSGKSVIGKHAHCFDYNTVIETNKGWYCIGDIVENRIDCKPLGYDHAKEMSGFCPIRAYQKRPGGWLSKVTFDNGHYFFCTPDHPVYVPDQTPSYLPVLNLKPGDIGALVGSGMELHELCPLGIAAIEHGVKRSDHVYNLQTTSGNYFANGILVHNCTVVDDALDPEAVMSQADMATISRWMTETLPSRKVNRQVSPTLLVMQRLGEGDPADVMSQIPGNRLLRLPICLDFECYPPEMEANYVNGLFDPVRFPREVIDRIEAEQGPDALACQYGQSPVSRSGNLFRIERLSIRRDVPTSFQRMVRSWDKAGTQGGSGAYTAGVLIAQEPSGRFWIVDVIRERLDTWERETLIRATGRTDGGQVEVAVEQEPGSGGLESAQMTVNRLAGLIVHVVRPSGDKALRAVPLSVQVNASNVAVADRHWTKEFLHELRLFPKSRYADQVDAASMGFTVLTSATRRVGGLR